MVHEVPEIWMGLAKHFLSLLMTDDCVKEYVSEHHETSVHDILTENYICILSDHTFYYTSMK